MKVLTFHLKSLQWGEKGVPPYCHVGVEGQAYHVVSNDSEAGQQENGSGEVGYCPA